MKVVIEISDETFMFIKSQSKRKLDFYERKILNGTPLPKGHGELIDRGALPMEVQSLYDIRLAPTIIEADKE